MKRVDAVCMYTHSSGQSAGLLAGCGGPGLLVRRDANLFTLTTAQRHARTAGVLEISK